MNTDAGQAGSTDSHADRVPTAAGIETRRFPMRDGIHLAGDVGGKPDAATVVLMHGGGQTRHSWAGAMRALMDAGYFVINYDARGHGESDWSPDGNYSMLLRAHDLADILVDVHGPIALVGASMGGATALFAIGADIEPAPAVIVMVDIVPRPDPLGTARVQEFMRANPQGFASVEEAADAVARYNPHRPRPRNPDGLMRNLRRRTDGRLYWHWDPRMLERFNEPERHDLGAQMSAHARRIRVPTLLVHGLASDVVNAAGIAEFRACVPQLEIFDVQGAGHMVAGDHNDAFNEGVLQFLRRHLPS